MITGSNVYIPLAEKYRKPFVVAGFEAEHILAAIYRIMKQLESGENAAENLYRNAVKEDGNRKAVDVMNDVFEEGPAMWRGLGVIENSGLYLNDAFSQYDGGSRTLYEDMELPAECRCGDVIVGRINPDQCPMFGRKCSPMDPFGPCGSMHRARRMTAGSQNRRRIIYENNYGSRQRGKILGTADE